MNFIQKFHLHRKQLSTPSLKLRAGLPLSDLFVTDVS